MADIVDNEPNHKGLGALAGYIAFRCVLFVLWLMPLPVAAWCAGKLSRFAFAFVPRRKQEALARMSERYGADRAAELLRSNLEHYGVMIAELAHWQRIWKTREQRFVVHGAEHFAAAREEGAVLVITGHISNWELLIMGHSLHFGGGKVPVKRVHNAYLNNWIDTMRKTIGVDPVADRQTAKLLLSAMRNRESVCFLADQNTQDTDAVWVPFLGETAATRVGPAMLAIRGKATVLSLRGQRVRPGYFELHYGEPLTLAPSDQKLHQRLFETTKVFNDELSRLIDAAPEQWLWMHRRWKRKPPSDVDAWRIGNFESTKG